MVRTEAGITVLCVKVNFMYTTLLRIEQNGHKVIYLWVSDSLILSDRIGLAIFIILNNNI